MKIYPFFEVISLSIKENPKWPVENQKKVILNAFIIDVSIRIRLDGTFS